jgi:hypothetical protein
VGWYHSRSCHQCRMNNNSTLDLSGVLYAASNDEDKRKILYEFITNGVLLNVIGILGIFGNIISMIILSRPQMKSSINYLLIGLARCDTVLIITSVLLFGIPAIYKYTGYLFLYYFKVRLRKVSNCCVLLDFQFSAFHMHEILAWKSWIRILLYLITNSTIFYI